MLGLVGMSVRACDMSHIQYMCICVSVCVCLRVYVCVYVPAYLLCCS